MLSPRNNTPQYRGSPHYLAYNPAENAILLCSVSALPQPLSHTMLMFLIF